ncbi:hypothetical protein GCM10007385_44160 [Tateyamaria omphalii]|uniref:calcium-binding protein n=1 Tax=Tateyamaria omphalii TaxID=299262 RepID=UPI0016752CA8|nr:calcium-binding protein [Tateyamaria omphalii]GGX70322.1 hypothetical protein GCM10007385_44160 [Tateyamaria omphalii]
MSVTFTTYGAVTVSNGEALVGVMDLELVETAQGAFLFTATRGDGWLTAFDLGTNAGDTRETGSWSIPAQYLQLESTDIEVRATGGNGYDLFLAGLDSTALRGVDVTVGQGNTQLRGGFDSSSSGFDAGNIAEMALLGGGGSAFAALRSGGLAQITFTPDGDMQTRSIAQGGPMSRETATDIVTTTHNGQTFAVVSYGSEDTLSLFRTSGTGTMQHVVDIDASDGFWGDRPGEMVVVQGTDGGLYIVVTSSGSSTLTVLAIDPDGGGMEVVDHIIDSQNTRFDDASYITSVMVNGQTFVLAAGTDSGLSLFALMAGGRLQHVETVAGTVDAPLRGISGLTATATDTGARIFVTTQAAPYLVEFSFHLDNPGLTRHVADTGGGVAGGHGDDYLNGGTGDDVLTGNAGDDVLFDGAGADTLSGGAGADLFILADDADTDVILDFQRGVDRIDISAIGLVGGIDNLLVLSRSWGAELRYGTAVIEVRSADGSSLTAGDFGAGTIIADGRPSVDPDDYTGEGPAPPDPDPDPNPGLPVTRRAGPQPDAPDVLQQPEFDMPSNPQANRGSAANDMLEFGTGNDIVFGNSGNDTIMAGDGRDSVSGDGGQDWIDGGTSNDLIFGGAGFDTLFGDTGNDTLVGGAHADSLFGGRGRDILIGGDGYDQLFGGSGNDRMWSGATADRLYGGDGDDWMSAGINFGLTTDGLWGEAGNDTMFGDAGFDFLDGGDGMDLMDGGAQADNLYGGADNDTLFGGQGLDRLFGGTGDDQLLGGTENDGHFGEAGNDTAWGGSGNDRFFGGTGDDILMGEGDQDTLYGGAGFDTIVGGAGNDLLFGNFNADRFVFEAGHGHDTIGDFNAANSLELMDFSDFDGLNSVSDVLSNAVQVGRDIVLTTSATSSIRLINVSLSDLGADDFIF